VSVQGYKITENTSAISRNQHNIEELQLEVDELKKLVESLMPQRQATPSPYDAGGRPYRGVY